MLSARCNGAGNRGLPRPRKAVIMSSGTNDAERLAKLMADPVNNLREIAELLGQVAPETRRDPDKPVKREGSGLKARRAFQVLRQTF